jgi:fused signal recognition particle receptor
MEHVLILVAIVVVVAGGGGGAAALVRSRRHPSSHGQQDSRTGAAGTLEPPAGQAGTADSSGTSGVAGAAGSAGTVAPPGSSAPPVQPPAATRPVETPPPSAGRLVRLRGRLARSQSALGSVLLNLLSQGNLDEQAWEQIEDTLITADMGVAPAQQLVEQLRTEVKVAGSQDAAQVRAMLRADLLAQLGPDLDRSLHTKAHGDRPAVVLVVGVNGTGKTTACGRLARSLIGDGQTVLLGAADTFRAAAADQLQTWGDRVGAETIRSDREGADPASVAFSAVNEGIARGVDTVIVDTAGRLHTKTGLMDELGKIKRVIEKHGTVDEVLLVLDATTGQNGLRQARVFGEVTNVTGIILTKLDGTAKGGIVIAVQRELGVPVKLVGLGEGPDDLAPFDPEVFVDAILGG